MRTCFKHSNPCSQRASWSKTVNRITSIATFAQDEPMNNDAMKPTRKQLLKVIADVLDHSTGADDIEAHTGLEAERCEEIYRIYLDAIIELRR
jgi:hypothetical protein